MSMRTLGAKICWIQERVHRENLEFRHVYEKINQRNKTNELTTILRIQKKEKLRKLKTGIKIIKVSKKVSNIILTKTKNM